MKVTFFNGSTSTSVTTAPQVIAGSVDPALVETLVIDATAPLAGAVDALTARVAALENGGVTPPAQVAPAFTAQPSLIGSTALGSTITVSLGTASGIPAPTLTGTLTRPGKAAVAVLDGDTFEVEASDQGGTIALDATATNSAGSAVAPASLQVPLYSLLFLNSPPALITQFTVNASAPDAVTVTADSAASRSVISWAVDAPVGSVISFNWTISNTAKRLFVTLTAVADTNPEEGVLASTGGSGSVTYVVTQPGQKYLNLVMGSGKGSVIDITNFKVLPGNAGDLAPTFTRAPKLVGFGPVGGVVTVDLGAASGTPTPALTGTLNRPGKAPLQVSNGHTFAREAGDDVSTTSISVTASNRVGSVTLVGGADAAVNYPGAMTSWTMPAPPPAWAPPAGWSSLDPHWDNVAAFLDFRRFIGLDQSEQNISIDYVPERLPEFDDAGVVFAGDSGLVSSYSTALAGGNVDSTIELFGVVPSGFVARAENTSGGVNWSVAHDGAQWSITVHNGGTPLVLTAADALPATPVDLALVRSGGTLSVYRDGALLTSAACGAWMGGATTCRIVVAGSAAPFSALSMAGLRVTQGVARYASAYTPAYPPVTTTKRGAGGLRVSYGLSTGHSSPNVDRLGDRLIFGTTTKQPMVGDYDPATQKARIKAVGLWDERDDHNNTSFVVLPNGQAMYVGTTHGSAGWPQFTGVTATPYDILSVDKREFQPPGISRTTYNNLVRLEGLPGAPIFLIGRVGANAGSWRPYMARTYDLGVTWETVGYLTPITGQRPYLNICKTSPTRFDIFSTFRHPDSNNPGLVHFYYEDGAFRNSPGRVIKGEGQLPFNLEDATLVFDGTIEPANSWNQHISRIGNKLAFVGTVNNFVVTGGPGYWGHYIRGVYDLDNPGAWTVEYICTAGSGAPTSKFYYPGASVDIDNEDVCYASVNVYGLNQQIVEFHRVSQGNWQAVRQITNLRAGFCQRPRTYFGPDGKYLTWMEIEEGQATGQMRVMKL